MSKVPRVVVVTRPTDYEALIARHGTREQARFFSKTRGVSLDETEARHHRFHGAVQTLTQAIPTAWRRIRLGRADLAQFVFEPDDIVAAVGQDGLVANVAKYLSGQLVIGLNPDPEVYPGVLVRHRPEEAASLLAAAASDNCTVQTRTMVEARLPDGQRLLALNEIFVGHTSHQSARYRLHRGEQQERHSSSGLIVSTGTGATGWALSIHRQLRTACALPSPEEPKLAFFVREPWPSIATGTSLASGLLDGREGLDVVSEMNEGGTLFGDGIEQDRIELPWGTHVTLRVAPERLRVASTKAA
ncbi:hypothetical protein LVJ94_39830 [Pendulispora rubella]|uniref:NAD kinase n=1 Tax=Pendulispora rubella TaxID=2741070 RepID=A0ABZ2L1D9_9BACT